LVKDFIQETGTSLTAPQIVDATMARNADRPIKYRPQGTVEGDGPIPDLEENILDHFFRLTPISQDVNSGGKQNACQAIIQFSQRRMIPLHDATEQFRVQNFGRLLIQHMAQRRPSGTITIGSPTVCRTISAHASPKHILLLAGPDHEDYGPNTVLDARSRTSKDALPWPLRRDAAESGWRVNIINNQFHNFSGYGLVIAGNGRDDSNINIQGNNLSTGGPAPFVVCAMRLQMRPP
jgi:hypothetical protein